MLNTRREAILEAIVREYTETGVPVASVVMTERYQFPFSTATIRAEMAELEREGYLGHPHTSAGRVPTEKGYRYFVNMIKEERALLAPESVVAKKRIFSASDHYEKKVEAASKVLAELTRNIAFSGFPGEIYSSGLGHLFSQPEFVDPYSALKAAEIVDNLNALVGELPREFDTEVYIGSEAPIGKGAGCSLVVSQFRMPDGGRGYLGVVGPMRMSYPKTIAAIKEVRKVLEEQHG
jgi:transcriptional regulator of heat shock response